MSEIDNRIEALAELLGESPARIEYQGDGKNYPDKWDEYVFDGSPYFVVTNSEADDMVYERAEDQADDIGEVVSWMGDRIFDYIDEEWLADCCRDYFDNVADDMEESELIQECLDLGIIEEDDLDEDGEYIGRRDLADEYATYQFESYADDYLDWYITYCGEEDLLDTVAGGYACINTRELIEYLCNYDDRGSELNGWDGAEEYKNGYYIYRRY